MNLLFLLPLVSARVRARARAPIAVTDGPEHLLAGRSRLFGYRQRFNLSTGYRRPNGGIFSSAPGGAWRPRARKPKHEISAEAKAEAWDISWVKGACGKADEGTDCSTDNAGSWWLTTAEAASRQQAITACEARCHACTGCRFVSLRWHQRDCSWYTTCDLKKLKRSPTHRTRAVAVASERTNSYEHWLRNATGEAFPATKLTPLEHFYRLEWQRRFDQTPGTFHFLSLPWHEIVEGPLNQGPSPADLRSARRLWNRLDWSRRHFILLNQCSMTQLNLHRREPGFEWMRGDRLTVFDSRLWGLQLAAAGRASVTELVPTPLLNFKGDAHYAPFQRCRDAPKTLKLLYAGRTGGSAVPRPGRNVSKLRGWEAQLQARFGTAAIQFSYTFGNYGGYRLTGSRFSESLCSTTWFLVISGVFPPAFMIAEAMNAGALPIFLAGPGSLPVGVQMPRPTNGVFGVLDPEPHQWDHLLPFHDEGVSFSRFGAVIPVDSDDIGAKIEQLLSLPEENVRRRQEYMRSIISGYTAAGTFSYALRLPHHPNPHPHPNPIAPTLTLTLTLTHSHTLTPTSTPNPHTLRKMERLLSTHQAAFAKGASRG